LSCNRCAAIHIAQWKNGEVVLQVVDTKSKKKDSARNQPLLSHLLASDHEEKVETLISNLDLISDTIIPILEKIQKHDSTTNEYFIKEFLSQK